MKYLAVFLAALLISLSFIDRCGEAETAMYDTATQAGAHHPDDQRELCSPFCSCARCAFSVIVPAAVVVFQTIPVPQARDRAEWAASPVKVVVPVWQPPKTV